MRSTHRRRKRRGTVGAASPAPHRAEQESDAERHRQRGVGPRSERLVDRIDHLVADLLHGVDGVLALGADVGNHALDVGSRARPRRVALGREDVGDLRGQPRHVVSQRLQIRLDIVARRRCGLAALTRRVFGVPRRFPNRVPNRIPDGAGCAGHWLAPLETREIFAIAATRRKGKSSTCRLAPPCQSGSLLSSGGNRWVIVTRMTIVSGTARNAPIGPHSQAQKASASSTASGLSVRRWPNTVGVMNWPSTVATPTNAAGGTSAYPSDGNVTRPTPNKTTVVQAAPIYGT